MTRKARGEKAGARGVLSCAVHNKKKVHKPDRAFGCLNNEKPEKEGVICCPACGEMVRLSASGMHGCCDRWRKKEWKDAMVFESQMRGICGIKGAPEIY